MLMSIKLQNLVLGDNMKKAAKNFKEKFENNIFVKAIKILLFIVMALLLLVVGIQKFSNNDMSFFGVRVFMVVSGSMEEEYHVGDILVSKAVKEEDINVGDNITYRGQKSSLNGLIVTHKVIQKEERDGVTYFTTKGLANTIPDPEITYNQIYGKIIYRTKLLSTFGKLMNNRISYYILFMTIGVVISIEIISSMFNKDDGDDGE